LSGILGRGEIGQADVRPHLCDQARRFGSDTTAGAGDGDALAGQIELSCHVLPLFFKNRGIARVAQALIAQASIAQASIAQTLAT
jgi:hypothetical protein